MAVSGENALSYRPEGGDRMRHIAKGKLHHSLFHKPFGGLILLASTVILIASPFFISATATHAASYCQVTYTITNQWPGGFGASISIQNTSSSAWTSWSLSFTFPDSN